MSLYHEINSPNLNKKTSVYSIISAVTLWKNVRIKKKKKKTSS